MMSTDRLWYKLGFANRQPTMATGSMVSGVKRMLAKVECNK